MGKLDLRETYNYITKMRCICEDLFYDAKRIAKNTQDIGAKWCDDIYRKTCNVLCNIDICLNKIINNIVVVTEFVEKEIYIDTYENYFRIYDYQKPPAISTGNISTKNLEELTLKRDFIANVTSDDLKWFTEKIGNYINNLIIQLNEVEREQQAYGQFNTFARYDIITSEIKLNTKDAKESCDQLKQLREEIIEKIQPINKQE